MKTKSYKVGFFQARFGADGKGGSVIDLLLKSANEKGMSKAIACGDHLLQIRGIAPKDNGNQLRGYLVRFREDTPLVTRQDSPEEVPLALNPGDELVERNHFIIYREGPDLEVIAYQNVWEGTPAGGAARYLTLLNDKQETVSFDDILTKDAYEALATGGLLKSVEFRVAKPRRKSYVPDPEDTWTQEGIEFMKGTGATTFQVKIATRQHDKGLMIDVKKRIKLLLNSVLTRKLVVKLSDIEEPVDLFAQRISDRITVELVQGQAESGKVFAALAQSKQNTQNRLNEVYGQGDEVLE